MRHGKAFVGYSVAWVALNYMEPLSWIRVDVVPCGGPDIDGKQQVESAAAVNPRTRTRSLFMFINSYVGASKQKMFKSRLYTLKAHQQFLEDSLV